MVSLMQMIKAARGYVKGDDPTLTGVTIHRALTILSYYLVLYLQVTTSFFTFSESFPTIWAVNEMNPTMYALEKVSVLIYWFALNLLQMGYMVDLCTENDMNFGAVRLVGPHFILHNLLHSLWICSWATSQFWVGEIFLALNVLNLSTPYLSKDPHTLPIIHLSIVDGPLVWTTFAIFTTTGAILDTHGKGYTGILSLSLFTACGVIPTVHRNDYKFGFCFVFLIASLALQQFKLSYTESGLEHVFQMGLAYCMMCTFIAISCIVLMLHLLERLFETFELESQRTLKEDDPKPLPGHYNHDYAHEGLLLVDGDWSYYFHGNWVIV